MAVPNIFAAATGSIPLSQLDANFNTAITLGNTAVYLGNTTTTLGNVTFTNATISSGNISVGAQGRLTLTSNTAVTTSDVSSATTVYFTPYQGNNIEIYNGTIWTINTFTEMSQATTDATKSPAAVAANSNYDVFVWLDGSTMRATRGPAWTSGTARGTGVGTTELELFEGRYVNKVDITNGPLARRGLYVGSIRSDGSSKINMTTTNQHVWNAFNRTNLRLYNYFTADRGTNSGSYVELNSEIRINFLVGLQEDAVYSSFSGAVRGDNTSGTYVHINIGLDGATPFEGEAGYSASSTSGFYVPAAFATAGFMGLGSHYLTIILVADGGGVTATMPGSATSGKRTALYAVVRG